VRPLAGNLPRRARLGVVPKLAAFLRRDFIEASSYKFSFIYSLLGIFFSSATFYFISRLISPQAAVLEPYGGNYFSFAMVGLAFSGLLGIFQEGLPEVIRSAQVSGTLEALLVTRTSIPAILSGSSMYTFLFALLRTAVHLGLAVAVFGMQFGRINVLGLVCILVLTALCFLSLGILSASFILVFKIGNPIAWLFGSVSGLLGGMAFPVAVLPPWIRWASVFLPITHSLEGLRRSLLSSSSFSEILPSVAALAAFSAVLLPISFWTFRLSLRKAKKDGTLTQY
jgi:ABC-2 type transport system permease protein